MSADRAFCVGFCAGTLASALMLFAVAAFLNSV